MTPDPVIVWMLAAHIVVGGTCAAWIHWRLQRWPGIGRVLILWTLGFVALPVVAVLELWVYLLRGGMRRRDEQVQGRVL